MKVELDIDLEKFRYSLVGDGYLKEEVDKMSEEELVGMLTRSIHNRIEMNFEKSKCLGLLD